MILKRDKMNKNVNLIQESPLKAFILLGIPIILLLIFNESYTILDTYFLAKLGNSVIIAISYITQLVYFLNRTGKGLGRGVSSMIARLIGAKDYENINNIALHGVLILAVISIIFQLIFVFGSTFILKDLLKIAEYALIQDYMMILVGAVFLFFLSEYLVEILNGEGNTRMSTLIMSFGVILNIVLDYVFIFIFKLNIMGASMATSSAYIITSAIFLYIYAIKKSQIIEFKLSDFKFDIKIILEILTNAIPIILDSTIVTLVGLVMITSMKNFAEPVSIVAYTLIIRIQLFLFTPTQGFSRSCNIVVGHLFGAKRFDDAKKQLNQSILVSLALNGLMALILLFYSQFIISFFTTDYVVLEEVRNILFLAIFELVEFSVIYNSNQSLVAIGRSGYSLLSVIVKFLSLLVFILIICVGLHAGRHNGVFLSLILGDGVQAIYTYLTFRRWVSKEKEKEMEKSMTAN